MWPGTADLGGWRSPQASAGTPKNTRESAQTDKKKPQLITVGASVLVELAGREKWCNTCAATQPNQRVTLCFRLHRMQFCDAVGKRGTPEKPSRMAL